MSVIRSAVSKANVVLVMSSYPGASASDVENNLTKLLENTLNSVANLKNLTSRSRENVAIVMLEFKYGTDIDEASNDIRDKLDLINSALPDGASVPVLFKFGMDDMPVLILSATADKSMAGLDRILDDRVVTPLGRVTGVGTVSVAGAPAREIHVYCDPNKLAAYGLSVAGISQIIAAENRNVPSGSIDIGSESFSLRVEKEFKDPSELLDVVVSYRGGQVVYLKDVARVEDGQQHSGIGLCSGVGLHIGPFGIEKLLHALAGKVFHLVHHLATAIIALAGKALGVFVGEATAHGLHYLVADEIL